MALLADLTRPASRTRAMFAIGISIGASFVISLVAGPLLAGAIGVSGVFVLIGALGLVALAIVLFALPAQPARADRAPPVAERDDAAARAVLRRHLHAAPDADGDFHRRAACAARPARHRGRRITGSCISPCSPRRSGCTVPLMLWSERNRNGRASLAGGWLLAGALVALVWAQADLRWLGAALALYFGAFNFLESRLPAALTEAAGEESRGAALGVFATCQFAGAFAGGLMGGALLGNRRRRDPRSSSRAPLPHSPGCRLRVGAR